MVEARLVSGVKRKQSIGDFVNRVVHEISIASRFRYLSQTARCLNRRMTDYVQNVRVKASQPQLVRHFNGGSNSYPGGLNKLL